MTETPPTAHRSLLRALRGVLLLSGLATITVGVAVDWLRSGGSQGFGPAQIALVAVGLALVASSLALGARSVQDLLLPVVQHPWKTAILVILSGALYAGAMEVALAILGQRPMYAGGNAGTRLSVADWWMCDDLGCRFDPENARTTPASEVAGRPFADIFFQRMRVVNSLGFHDDDEFTGSQGLDETFKVLVLGDSFTFGFYAPLGQSWAEVLEADLGRDRPLTLWNTGIPGAATVQEVAVLKHFFPILRPDLVLLTFYPANDIDGNLYPAGSFHGVESGSLIPRYKVGPGLEPVEMTPADAYYRATGIRRSGDAGPVAAVLGRTRTGSFFLSRWARLQPDLEWLWSPAARATPGNEAKWRRAAARTRELLAEAKAFVERRGSRFLLVLIPSPRDLQQAGDRFLTGKEIVRDLAIETVEVTDHLVAEDYLPRDEHWNPGGHAKVGRRMAEYIRSVQD